MSQVNINTSVKLSGRFKLVVKDKEGNTTKETGWMDNLITNAGLEHLGTGNSVQSILGNFTVGTGNTLPAFTDTALSAPLIPPALKPQVPLIQATYVAGTPPYWKYVGQATFDIGTATGILAEIGIYTGANDYLFSRALIVDSSGNPTTITVLSTESLQVNYEFRLNWDITTHSGTILINGITYNLTWLPSFLGTPQSNFPLILSVTQAGISIEVGNGILGDYLHQPSGLVVGGIYSNPATYTVGNLYVDFTFDAKITDWNVTGGINIMYLSSGSFHQYQIGFSPAIPKDSTHSMTFSCRFGWGRV